MKYDKFLGYHSSSSPRLEGLQKGDVLDEDRYEELIREIFITYFQESDISVEQMNEYFEDKGYGFTFVSDKPIRASSFQHTEYKYGDYLYKVYGTGKEMVADDPNEVNAEIIISKAPLLFKKVKGNVYESAIKIFVNESNFDAAIQAKKAGDYLIMYIRTLARKELLDKRKYTNIKLTGKRIGNIYNQKDAGSLSIKIRTDSSPFNKVFMAGMPDFYLFLEDGLSERGLMQITGKGYSEIIIIKINMGGVIADFIDGKASQMDVYKALLDKRTTLYHEIAHLYDYVYDNGNFEDDDDVKDGDFSKYVSSRHEKYANISEALSVLLQGYVKDGLENLLVSYKKAYKNNKLAYKNISIKEIMDIYGFKKEDLKKQFADLYFNKLSKYSVYPSKEQRLEILKQYDKYAGKIEKMILKNIKGILDGSIKDQSQLLILKKF